MEFTFHADFVHSDTLCRRVSFAGRCMEAEEHYFILSRLEGSEEALPDLEDVYIERDDQCWGGYGGIQRIVLTRADLTVALDPRMARHMGEYETIRITYSIELQQFERLRQVVELIVRGYEARLSVVP